MRALLTISLLIVISTISFAQGKIEVIYNNGLTHTTIKADIFQGDTVYMYTVTDAKMWTGETTTKIIYKGAYDDFYSFLISALDFAVSNKKNIGARTVISGIPVEMTKKVGVKCIMFGTGEEAKNTNEKSIQGAVTALNNWRKR